MIQYEDLFIKICHDFHNEINPLLIEIEPSTKQEFWFERKSINGKFYILKDLLLSLNRSDVAQYQLISLRNILKKYKTRLEIYFESHNVATCFIYFSPENTRAITGFFKQLDDYGDYRWSLHIGHLHMIGFDMVGFPNDCSFKLSARFKNGEITIQEHRDPMFEIEREKGKLIGYPQRTRQEQVSIEDNFIVQNPEHWAKANQNAINEFEDFAKNTHTNRIELINDFDKCNDLCNTLIDSIVTNTTPQNLPELERIYSILYGTYIEESLEKFISIFNNNFFGEKLIWLKSGPELKYLIDQLNGRLKISDEINKWAGIRIEMNTSVKDLSIYLRKQTTKGEYLLLNHGNLKKDPLFKLFREH